MKKFILRIVVVFFVTNIAFSQTDKYQNIRTGNFLLLDSINGNTFIKRRNNFQIEYGEKSGLKLKLRVIWINENKYRLELLKVLKNPYYREIPKHFSLKVQIIEANEQYYIVNSYSTINNSTVRRKIIILKRKIIKPRFNKNG